MPKHPAPASPGEPSTQHAHGSARQELAPPVHHVSSAPPSKRGGRAHPHPKRHKKSPLVPPRDIRSPALPGDTPRPAPRGSPKLATPATRLPGRPPPARPRTAAISLQPITSPPRPASYRTPARHPPVLLGQVAQKHAIAHPAQLTTTRSFAEPDLLPPCAPQRLNRSPPTNFTAAVMQPPTRSHLRRPKAPEVERDFPRTKRRGTSSSFPASSTPHARLPDRRPRTCEPPGYRPVPHSASTVRPRRTSPPL
jgi:hypothetical protein